MHTDSLDHWTHEHTIGQDRVRRGERRTVIVTGLTAVTMAVEIAAGMAFGSMALLADGLHMTSRATALEIAVPHDPPHSHDHHHHGGSDHNLRGAYLHVLADSLTSVLAISALLMGRSFGAVWMDPAMGIVGAAMVARWSWGLLRHTSRVLLDQQAPEAVRNAVREAIEAHEGDRIADLHVWSIGPDIYAAAIALVSYEPKQPDHYKELIPKGLGIVHVTVEAHPCTVSPV